MPLTVNADTGKSEARQRVETTPCKSGRNIGQLLGDTIKTLYANDLGWRVFAEDTGYTVERAVAVNKMTEIHYRWRIDPVGHIEASNERTQSLCMS